MDCEVEDMTTKIKYNNKNIALPFKFEGENKVKNRVDRIDSY